MRAAGQAICAAANQPVFAAEGPPEAIRAVHWMNGDMRTASLPRADLVIASYSIGELPMDAALSVAEKLFDAARKLLILVEPGTPGRVRGLLAIREALLNKGAYMAAPCPHEAACPLPAGDWCHFSVRVERTRLHKRLKGGDAPFEDEKYCYMAFVREPPSAPRLPRVLRHPYVRPGNISLELCLPDASGGHGMPAGGGALESRIISKRDKDAFRTARKAGAGDVWAPDGRG